MIEHPPHNLHVYSGRGGVTEVKGSQEREPVAEKLVRRLRFRGFDHSDALEGHMARYARDQMRDENRWEELPPQVAESDNGNSRMQTLECTCAR